MTHFLQDILRQPEEMKGAINYLRGDALPTLERAAGAVRKGRHVYLTGIGSSWHAALSAQSLFHGLGFPVHARDVAELLHFDRFPTGSVIILISRSGRSAEVVNLLPKARQSGATVIGVTNSADNSLAQQAHLPLVIPVRPDHGISVNSYSTLSLAAGALASAVVGSFDAAWAVSLERAVSETVNAVAGWQKQIADSSWLAPRSTYYFLARSSSLGSCNEARLLWEEGVKSPATALGTGAFRHGPQEMVAPDVRFGIWIDGQEMREQDLAVAWDLARLGASVMLIGQDLPGQSPGLSFHLPRIPAAWQFLIDIIPAQLAAERLSRLSGVDCDSFRICPYVVETESGLLPERMGDPEGQTPLESRDDRSTGSSS
jgi:glucosamine--fructose-6-phosphate aminotransferase (isomerizing)